MGSVLGSTPPAPTKVDRRPGLAALVEHGRTALLVPPGEPLSLVAATRRLLDDPPFADRLRAAGRHAALADHSASNIAARWAEVYGVTR